MRPGSTRRDGMTTIQTESRLKYLLKLYGDQFLDLSEQDDISVGYLEDKLEAIRRVLLAAAENDD